MNGQNLSVVDETLIRRVVEEDSVVRAYVYAATRGHRETQDVIQEVWRVVCRKIADYDESRPFRSWVLGIARLQVLKWRQGLARSHEVLAPDVLDLLAETAATEREELDLRGQYLRDCIGEMHTPALKVLRMKYFDGLKSVVIAEQLKKSVASVDMTLVRLRRGLRDCIEQKLAANPDTVGGEKS